MQNAVQLKIDEKNLVQNLGYVFTNSTQFINELIQNARRSGATRVDINTYDASDEKCSVSFADNGKGIADMQDLLTVAHTDWDDEAVETEHPFGMGFLSAVFAGKKIKVESLDHAIEFERDELVVGNKVRVTKSATHRAGTLVSLADVDASEAKVRQAVEMAARGFPIRITLNGKEVERPDALDTTRSIRTEAGWITSREGDPGSFADTVRDADFAAYLQGLPILGARGCRARWIVHLDHKKFRARMPDRDTLIDAKAAYLKVLAAIKNAMHEELQNTLAKEIAAVGNKQRGEEQFVVKHWTAITRWHPEMLDTMDVVPAGALMKVTDYPTVSEYPEHFGAVASASGVIHREEIEDGKYQLIDLQCFDPENEPEDACSFMVAYKQGRCAISDGGVASTHWLHKCVPARGNWHAEPRGEVKTVPYVGNFVSGDVVFCKSWVVLDEDTDAVVCEFDDMPFYDGDRILYPLGAGKRSTRVLSQATDFKTDDYYNEGDEEREVDMFERFLRKNIGERSALEKKMMEALNAAGIDMTAVHAYSRFQVEINDGKFFVTLL